VAAASIVAELAVQAAIRHAIGAGHLGIHAGMRAMVRLHLGCGAMRTVVIVPGFVRHCAWRQREIQPDSHKQSKGAAAPGSLFAPDAAWMTQVLVSTRISALLPDPDTEAIRGDPCASRATITPH
jgi:hypothetical protein